MGFDAGRLRHVVDFERRVEDQDETTGGVTTTWATLFENVRVAIEPLSTREFIAAGKEQSGTVARIVTRYRPGMDSTQRIVHRCCRNYVGEEIYNPQGFLRDKDSGLEYVTIPCGHGVNEG